MDEIKRPVDLIVELHAEFQDNSALQFQDFFFSLLVRGAVMKMRTDRNKTHLFIVDTSKGMVIQGNSFRELYNNWMKHYKES